VTVFADGCRLSLWMIKAPHWRTPFVQVSTKKGLFITILYIISIVLGLLIFLLKSPVLYLLISPSEFG
jgi:hypothetical protein